MDDIIQYGMVGGDVKAFIGEVHRKAFAFDPRARLVAGAFSVVPEYHELTADTYHVAKDRRYLDYREMAEKESQRPDGIDLVVICTPNALHYEVAKEFLLHNISVLCEKPLCFRKEEGEELLKITKEKDLLFAVNYGYTGYPMVKVAKEMIKKGELGTLLSVHAEYLQDWLLAAADPKTREESRKKIWRLNPKMSGSSCALGDIGTHAENLLKYLLGERPSQVFCEKENYGQELDLRDEILLRYPSGLKGSISVSQIALGHLNGLSFEIDGSEASLVWHQENPDHLFLTKKGRGTEDLSRSSTALQGYAASQAYRRLPAGHPEGLYEAFANHDRTIVTNLLKRKRKEVLGPEDEDYPHGEDGLEGVEFVEACLASASKQGWVDFIGDEPNKGGVNV
jgi:predicted dehydrogenase